MYLLAVFAPFLGSASAGLLGRFIGSRGSGILTIIGMFISFIGSTLILYEVGIQGSPVYITLGNWFSVSSISVYWSMYFDSLTACMMFTVTMVSLCVHIYSLGYMQTDPHLPRFMSYLSLFTFFMLILVSADNMLQMLVGFEGIGVCSFLLISFWFHRLSATKSAIKAMLVNRVSDTFLMISIMLMWWYLGSTDFTVLAANGMKAAHIDYICLLLLLGVLGKSAQIGQMKALDINKKVENIINLYKYYQNFILFRFLRYAGNSSYSFESAINGTLSFKSLNLGNLYPEKFQKHGENQQGKEIDKKFLEWFIGFVEGDGCFYISGQKPIFTIHLHIVDLPLLYEIQAELNMGSIHFNKDRKKALFTIKAKHQILSLINIFNGNLYLPKRKEQFKLWVNSYNKKHNSNIKVIYSNFLPSLSNGWLSGLTDAEGCFTVSIYKNKKYGYYKIIQRYMLAQKDSKNELKFISSLLKGYVEKSKNCDRLVINYLQLDYIINYMSEFPLRSSKCKSFNLWKKIWLHRKDSNNVSNLNVIKDLDKELKLLKYLKNL
jgi:hypothetical protein